MEILFDALADALGARRDAIEPAFIAVPNRAMERAIEVHVAQRLGIAQNLRFERIDALTSRLLEARAERVAPDPDARLAETPAEPSRWEALFLAVLHDAKALSRPSLAPVLGWLGTEPDARAARVVSLAARLAELVSSYDRKRPELVRAWVLDAPPPASLGLSGEALAFHESWQRAIARAARERGPAPFATELLDRIAREPIVSVAEPLHVIGLSHASRAIMSSLRVIDRQRRLTVYALDPCREFWEDVESHPEEARRMRRSSSGTLRAVNDEIAQESALLSAWGRAGREHLAELHELSGWSSEERFEDDTTPATALEEVQRSILERRPAAVRGEDASLLLLPCPSVRRELEVVASEIWARVADGAHFSDIAVLLHEGERERYLPLLPSVFTEARELPWSAVDVPFVWRSRIAAGALRLVALTTSEITRSRLLDLLFHPSVHAQMPEARASAWSAMLDRLGFFRGLSSPSERTGSESAGGGDLEQALDRLAIGAVSSGERSGITTPIGLLFPEEIDAAADESGGLYRILRSLASDLRFARTAELSLGDWARFYGAMLEAYLIPDGTKDEADLLRVRATLQALERRHIEGARYGAKVAESIFTRELSRTKTEVGAPLLSGVTVSTLVPMRALPFAHVFVLGLGEGRFAGGQEERGLDLSRGARQFGDVEDSERDRYTFLETLLSARESLTISWVARDEATGDAIPAASVVSELTAGVGTIREHAPPLRRHEDDARGPVAMDALLGAAEERRARRLGDRERDELSPDGARGASLAISAFAGLVHADDPRRALLTWDAVSAGLATEALKSAAAPTRLAPARLAPARLAPARLAPAGAAPGAAPAGSRASEPTEARIATVPELRVRLEQVRQFLERPMQAAAEYALGQSTGPSRDRVDEPPVTMGKAHEARLLRDAVRRVLEPRAASPRAILDERARRERAHGLLPEGALGARAIDALEERLTLLLEVLRGALGPATESPILAARFGPGRTLTELAELPLPLLDLGRGVRAERILAHGESHGWLADHGRAFVIVDPFANPTSTERRARTRVSQQLLRAFVDHAALSASASARHLAMGRTVHVVSPTGASTARFLPMQETVARDWLRALADELAKGHAAFLPGEIVLGEADRIRRAAPDMVEALEKALEKARAKDDRLSELYGPVRDAKERPGPLPSELLRVLGRRFGPFFEYVEIEAPPPGRWRER